MNKYVILEISETYSGSPFCDSWRVAIIKDTEGERIRVANFNAFETIITGVIISLDQKTISAPQYYTNEGKWLNEWNMGDIISCE